MPKIVKKVDVNLEIVSQKIALNFRNRTAFCEAMGEPPYWVTDLNRKKAVITPEKAAQMCLLLHTTPEEILLGVGDTEDETAKLQADIALVRQLVEQKSVKKAPDQQAGSSKEALLNFVRNTDDRAALLAVLDEVNRKLQELK